MKGRVFDINRFAIHDGPGIRTTVFLKGCPLGCVWCQNPEGIDPDKGLWILTDQCIHCRACVTNCHSKAISGTQINRGACDFCGVCTKNCPSRAIRRIDSEFSPEGLVKELLADRLFFNVSGGGVTLSGGEPLAQHEFSLAVLKLLKNEGIHTCMETSLYAPENVILELSQTLDYLICDVKLVDDAAHRKYTGKSNEIILSNFRNCIKYFPQVLVRIPLVHGITATEENLKAAGEFIRSCGHDVTIELLNYNWLCQPKYARLGKAHFNTEARPFSEEEINRFYQWVSPQKEKAICG
jgi:pyruvate formate lyase activating enzyme